MQPLHKVWYWSGEGVKRYIERTTHWARKSGLTLTFEHVTSKSIRIIYLLRATPAPSLVLIKWRGQQILSGQHLVYRPTDIPTDRPTVAKQYAPFLQSPFIIWKLAKNDVDIRNGMRGNDITSLIILTGNQAIFPTGNAISSKFNRPRGKWNFMKRLDLRR